MTPFDALPPLDANARAIVIVPARDEAAFVARALRALDAQRESFETIVFANGCRDATAERARAFARTAAHPVHVVEADLPGGTVGEARKMLMDAAAGRFRRAGSDGWIASTDADTRVTPDWLAATLREAAAGADAVMGEVDVRARDLATLPAGASRLYVWDRTYRRAFAHAEAVLDPVPWDPAPRHRLTYAASLAVRASVYERAGGLPPLARGEDAAFAAALARLDARVRHARSVRVFTSPRADGRVAGGFSQLVRLLHGVPGPEQWLVEAPEATLRRIRARAALRRFHASGGAAGGAAYRSVLGAFGLDVAAFAALYDPGATFGANAERVEDAAARHGAYAGYGRVPVARAVAVLQAAAGAAVSRSAMRASVASGAG